MPGARGYNRVPGADPRTRRNWNAQATRYNDRTLGNGLTLDANRLLTIDLVATGGLEFASGDLQINYPADGGVKTSVVGLEVDMSGMAANATPAEADWFLIEDSGGTDAKEKVTLVQLRDAIINPPADGAIKNTTNVFEVDISGMANTADPADGDHILLEDSGGSDAKERVTVAQLRTTLGSPWAVRTETTTYTAAHDDFVILGNHATTAFTITLPAAADVTGERFFIKNINAAAVTVDGAGAETIDDQTTVILSQYDSILVVSDGTEWWII